MTSLREVEVERGRFSNTFNFARASQQLPPPSLFSFRSLIRPVDYPARVDVNHERQCDRESGRIGAFGVRNGGKNVAVAANDASGRRRLARRL